MRRLEIWPAALVLLAACGGGGGGGNPDARPTADADNAPAATARFAPPATPGNGADWDVIPYPSDLYLDDGGMLALGSLPTGAGASADHVAMLLDSLATMDGAGLWSFAYFPIEGDVDPDTLTGNVVLVELDGLTEVPTDLIWRDDLSAILAVPKHGHLLAQKTAYAAYVTTDVKATDGSPLAVDDGFREVLDSSSTASNAGIEAARTSIAPLLSALDSATAGKLAVATVFRTESVSDEMVAMRDVVAASPPDGITVTETYDDAAELDSLFGSQTADAPPGTLHPGTGVRGLPHGNVAIVLHGAMNLKRFNSDDRHVDGFATFNGSGVPQVKGSETVRYTLILPTAGSWADLPIAIFVHGVNRTRVDMLSLADTITDHGMGLIAIDLPYHGDRAINAADNKNDVTGESVADGFGDVIELTPATRVFHLAASGGIPGYHPRAMRENLRQAAIDVCSLVEYVADGDVSAIQTAATNANGALPDDLSFNPDVALVSESLGALVSGPCVAVEPRLKAVAYSSPAAGFPYPSMLHSPNFAGLFQSAVTNPFGIYDRVVLGDATRDVRFEPIIMLYNSVLERGEASGFAANLLPGDLRGGTGAHLLMTMAWADEWVSNDTSEHFAGAIGLPRLLTPSSTAPPGDVLRFADLPEVSGPLQGNKSGITAGLTVYHPSAHASIRKLTDLIVFEPDHPPFVELADPVPLDPTPIVQMHQQWATFLDDYYGGMTPRIIDPYAN